MENRISKKTEEKLNFENDEIHLEETQEKSRNSNSSKIPLYAFYRLCGVSEKTLQEAANRYQQGIFGNAAFIFSHTGTAFKNQSTAGKLGIIAKLSLLPYYLIARKPIKVLNKKLFTNPKPKLKESNITKSSAEMLELIKEYPTVIQKIENPNEDLQLAAVNAQGNLIKFIKNPTPNVAWEAVHKDPKAIKYIKNAPFDLENYAIKEGGFPILGLLEEVTEQHLCALAIEKPLEIKFLDNPSRLVRKLAIEEDPAVLNFLSNPTEKEFMLAFKSEKLNITELISNHDNIPENVLIKCVQLEPNAIRLIKNPSDEVVANALINDFNSLTYINKPLNSIELEKVGMVMFENDINSIPKTILGVELSEQQRQTLLNKEVINDFPSEKTRTTTFSLSFSQDNILVLGEHKQGVNLNSITFSPIHIAKTNLIENSVEKPLNFDIEAFINRMTKPEPIEIIAPQMGMKLPF